MEFFFLKSGLPVNCCDYVAKAIHFEALNSLNFNLILITHHNQNGRGVIRIHLREEEVLGKGMEKYSSIRK